MNEGSREKITVGVSYEIKFNLASVWLMFIKHSSLFLSAHFKGLTSTTHLFVTHFSQFKQFINKLNMMQIPGEKSTPC